jgi:hypothetical protein
MTGSLGGWSSDRLAAFGRGICIISGFVYVKKTKLTINHPLQIEIIHLANHFSRPLSLLKVAETNL